MMRPARYHVNKALRDLEMLWGPPRSPGNESAQTVGAEWAGKKLGQDRSPKHTTANPRREAIQLYRQGVISRGTFANWLKVAA